VDAARGIAIVLVVVGHAGVNPALRTLALALHMPFFFVLAGYFVHAQPAAAADRPSGLGALARRRARRLLVPYAACAPAFYLLWLLVGRHLGSGPRAVPPATPLLGILYANGTGDWLVFNIALWFLPALFCAELLFHAALRVAQARGTCSPRPWRQAGLVAVAALLGYGIGQRASLPWSADVALVSLPFMFVGLLLAGRGRGGPGAPFLSPAGVLMAGATFALAVAAGGPMNMEERRFGFLPLFYVGAIARSLLLLEAARRAARVPVLRRILGYCGRESLAILVFHLLGFQVLAAVLRYGVGLEPGTVASSPVGWIAQVTFGVACSLALAAALKRTPVLREVFYPSRPYAERGRPVAADPPGEGQGHVPAVERVESADAGSTR
jgi:fucose 4-O-acetylase-like acetyltransferase